MTTYTGLAKSVTRLPCLAPESVDIVTSGPRRAYFRHPRFNPTISGWSTPASIPMRFSPFSVGASVCNFAFATSMPELAPSHCRSMHIRSDTNATKDSVKYPVRPTCAAGRGRLGWRLGLMRGCRARPLDGSLLTSRCYWDGMEIIDAP